MSVPGRMLTAWAPLDCGRLIRANRGTVRPSSASDRAPPRACHVASNRQRRPSAYDDDPLRAALHGRAQERLPTGMIDPVEQDPTETYGDRALALIDTIVAVASRRVSAAESARAATARTRVIRKTRKKHTKDLIRVANVLGVEIGIGTLYDERARELCTAHHAAAVRAWIDSAIADGIRPEALRDAIVDTALERGYSARDAAAIAIVAMLPADRRAGRLPVVSAGSKDVAGERSAQRRRKKLLAQREADLRGIEARLAEARAGRGMYKQLDTGQVADAIRALECERVTRWHLIGQLGGIKVARRPRISRVPRA